MTWQDPIWIQRGSGLLMIAVGLLVALLATRRFRIQWRWLWCGVLIFDFAVAVKFAFAAMLNEPVNAWLRATLPRPAFLFAGSLYGGLLTGVTEVALTLAAGLIWKQLAQDSRRAAGIGIGAGSNEAALWGVLALVSSSVATQPAAGPLNILLVPALERLIVIPIHTAVRMLVLYAVAVKSPRWFWAAFALFTAVDGLATYYHLSRVVDTPDGQAYSWWIELTFLPFGVASILIAKHIWKRWPRDVTPVTGGP